MGAAPLPPGAGAPGRGARPGATEPPTAILRDADDIWPEVGTWRPLHVVMLGGPGVGKTNLVAAMFAQLRSREDRRGYHLLCGDAGQYDDLTRLADALKRPGTDWPEPAWDPHPRRYEFVCMAPAGGQEYPVLRVCYWDFPGEALTGRGDDRGPLRRELSRRLAEAHAVIIAVDGVELRASEFDEARREAFEDLLERCVQRAGSSRCPVQLVVTKWDLVGWSRQRAVDALAGYPCLAGLFQTRRPRVIPVSVLGEAGCAVDEGGAVRRLYPAAPVNVDVAFAGILPDRLGRYLDGLDTAALEKRLRHARRGVAAGLVRTGLRAASLTLNVLKLVLPVSGAAAGVMDRLAGLDPGSWTAPYVLDKGTRERVDRMLIRDARRLRDAADRSEVAKYGVLAAFGRRLATFDREHDSSTATFVQDG